ncbi:MAG: hypothetical protein JXQ91_07605 [Vannielia sp.]|uniref:helix-turn-helix domain-containing protein n=1 Tax=Vannielia sp. TaxID=2813045 RepID=UPI003B8A9B15
MSIEVMREVWKYAQVDQGTLLVLLALADSADEETRTCYPGVKSLSKKSRLSERQVQYCLQKLREEKVITIRRNASPVKTNLYWIAPAKAWANARDAITAPPSDDPETQSATSRDEVDCVSETKPIAPKPSVTSEEPSDTRARRADDLFSEMEEPKAQEPDRFEEFWKVYPKKAGKAEAKRAWSKAVKKAPTETIIARARRYAIWLDDGSGEFRPAAKNAQGWLNGERWDDDVLKAPVSRPAMKASDYHAGGIVR